MAGKYLWSSSEFRNVAGCNNFSNVFYNLYIKLHNQLKICLSRKKLKFINLCILKKEGG